MTLAEKGNLSDALRDIGDSSGFQNTLCVIWLKFQVAS